MVPVVLKPLRSLDTPVSRAVVRSPSSSLLGGCASILRERCRREAPEHAHRSVRARPRAERRQALRRAERVVRTARAGRLVLADDARRRALTAAFARALACAARRWAAARC
jgi:hypothetical protein